MIFNYGESIQRILKIDAEVANLDSEKSKISNSICENIYPQLKGGTEVRFVHQGTNKQGIIKFIRLNKYNPFKVRIIILPLNKNFKPFNRVVVNCVTVNEEDLQ